MEQNQLVWSTPRSRSRDKLIDRSSGRLRDRSSSVKRKVPSPDQLTLEKKLKQSDIEYNSDTDSETYTYTMASNMNTDSDTQNRQEPPNPMMYQQQYMGGSPMIPHMPGALGPVLVASPPAQQQMSEHDVIRVASVLKQMLNEEIAMIIREKVEEKTACMQNDIDDLKSEIENLKTEKEKLTKRVDQMEQYSRKNNVRIGNMKETKDENVENIVMEVATKSGAKITKQDIGNSHRTGEMKDDKERDIIVQFTSTKAKVEFLRGRKVLRDKKEGIYLNEDLCKAQSDLAYEARILKRDRHSNVKSCWSFNGSIYILTHAEETIKINQKDDLKYHKIKKDTSVIKKKRQNVK